MWYTGDKNVKVFPRAHTCFNRIDMPIYKSKSGKYFNTYHIYILNMYMLYLLTYFLHYCYYLLTNFIMLIYAFIIYIIEMQKYLSMAIQMESTGFGIE